MLSKLVEEQFRKEIQDELTDEIHFIREDALRRASIILNREVSVQSAVRSLRLRTYKCDCQQKIVPTNGN